MKQKMVVIEMQRHAIEFQKTIKYLVLSGEFLRQLGHRKEIGELTFRALLALHRTESRNCELCVVYIVNYGATLIYW